MNQQDDNGELTGDDGLVAGYRRASADAAGRPAAKVRAAILAEAAAASARRTRASNDPYYLWRGAAGIAVLGIIGMLWKQVEQTSPRLELEPDPPVIVARAPVEEPAPAQVEAAANQAAEARRAESAPRPMPAESASAPRAAAPPREPFPATQSAAPAPASQSQTAPPAPTAPPVFGPPGAGGGARAGAADSANTALSRQAEDLARRYFPQQYASDRPRRVWVILDDAGEVVGTGELQEGQAYSDITDARARESAGTSNRAGWTQATIYNARGQPLQIGIASPR